MRTRFVREKGVTLVELLVVISIIAFLAGALVVASQKMRHQAQVNGTTTLIERLASANEQFYNEWRFYAPDSPITRLAGANWVYQTSPSIPDEIETREVDTDAPGIPPNDKVPTTGNEYMMISLVFKGQYLAIDQEHIAGPRRQITNLRLPNGENPTSRCIVVDSWGHPLFYDCHKPEGKRYALGRVMFNINAFDLFSLGADGRTSSTNNHIDDDGDGTTDESDEGDKVGQSVDDINNWRGTDRR